MPRNLFTPAAPAGSLTCSRVTMAPCTDSWRDPSASVVVHTISMAMGMDATCALACGGGWTQGWGGLAREKTRAAGQYYVTLHKFNVHGASRTHGTEIKGSKPSPWIHHIQHQSCHLGICSLTLPFIPHPPSTELFNPPCTVYAALSRCASTKGTRPQPPAAQ